MMKYQSIDMVIGFYSDNKTINEGYKSLNSQIMSLPIESKSTAFSVGIKFLELLNQIDIDNLFVSVTSSNSLFFRFNNIKSGYEFKFEIFYDYDECDETDIESTLHIYKNGLKESAHFGSVNYLFGIVKQLNPSGILVYGFNSENAPYYYPVHIGLQEYPIPQKPNPYRQSKVNIGNKFHQTAAVS